MVNSQLLKAKTNLPTKITPTIMPGAEPFFHRGNQIGCLCLHGFMASPNELRWMGEALAAQGFTVYVPRLTGHGIDHRIMTRMHWYDWYTSALDGYHILKAQCEQVIPIGLSMGGLLALMLAAEYPVAGVGVLASPLFVKARIVRHTGWLKYLVRYTEQPDSQRLRDVIHQEQVRRGDPLVGRVRYNTWATSAVWEFNKLMLRARACLPDVTAPLLTIYAQRDDTGLVENVEILKRESSSAAIESFILLETGHILSQDIERETVFQLINNFIRAIPVNNP
jgi:carboxylesterase